MTEERDRGSAGVEAAFAVVGLLAVGFFVVGALRITGSSSDVDSAARAAARAAASHYDVGAAQAAARSVATQVLGDRGIACRDVSIGVTGDLSGSWTCPARWASATYCSPDSRARAPSAAGESNWSM